MVQNLESPGLTGKVDSTDSWMLFDLENVVHVHVLHCYLY